VDVRIWGHYVVIDGREFTFYRHPIAAFDISPTDDGDQRWKAYSFVRNVHDLWLPEQFKRICSAIDMLPADLNFEVEVSAQSEIQSRDQESASRSGLSQQFGGYSVADEPRVVADGQQSAQPMTPDVTVGTGNSKKKKKT
jgi:hypothetical protein